MEKQVGETRKFSYDEREYTVREILQNPQIKMNWRWDTGVCAHCKKKNTHEMEHNFHRIEVLGVKGVSNAKLTRADVTLMGDTDDNKRLIITQDKYNEVLAATKSFSHLVEEGK